MNWYRKQATARFVLDGPESLVNRNCPSGDDGWMNQYLGLQIYDTPSRKSESWTFYLVASEVLDNSHLPASVMRYCEWDAPADRVEDESLRITTVFYEVPIDVVVPTSELAYTLMESLRAPIGTEMRSRRLARFVCKYYFRLAQGVFRATVMSPVGSGILADNWGFVKQIEEKRVIVDSLAERYLFPVVNERVTIQPNDGYGSLFKCANSSEELTND